MNNKLSIEAVSRETSDRLKLFLALLRQWQRKVNLVSPQSLPELWTRHVADSAQLWPLAPVSTQTWADLGSGGGFPGVICAMLALEENPLCQFILIEADQRKSAFLREVVRQTSLTNTKVTPARSESLAPLKPDVISARALAPLGQLLRHAHHHQGLHTRCLFLKGVNYRSECDEARTLWDFDCRIQPSTTSRNSAVLIIEGIKQL